MKKWLFIITLLLLQGCAILPWQVGVALNGADLLSATTTNKTLSEHALSAATDKDCQWYRLLDGEKACMNTAEEEAYLKEHKDMVEVEINPLFVYADKVCAVDALLYKAA